MPRAAHQVARLVTLQHECLEHLLDILAQLVSDVLRTLRLSANQCVEGGYEGPDKLLLRDVQVL